MLELRKGGADNEWDEERLDWQGDFDPEEFDIEWATETMLGSAV